MKEDRFGLGNQCCVANRECQYFLGATPDLAFTMNAIIGLSNPADSGVNLYLDTTTICNLSKELCRVQLCSAYHTLDGLQQVEDVSMGNLNLKSSQNPQGKLIYGVNKKISIEFNSCGTATLCEYETTRLREEGMIVIAPGTSHFYIVTSLIGLKKTTISMNFRWWEETI
ncbi:DUF6143 family protein [Cellulosilyticum ruminicola]|uniref:DUF6143 family protein n=1 Tax=Cellulosilyticum ruminicola TaxID=425254 RepID=UPI0006D09F1A|nr:DUF6143 family protein [Cellulosilyticum ruminicola]